MGLPAIMASENTTPNGSLTPILTKTSHQTMCCSTSRCPNGPSSTICEECLAFSAAAATGLPVIAVTGNDQQRAGVLSGDAVE